MDRSERSFRGQRKRPVFSIPLSLGLGLRLCAAAETGAGSVEPAALMPPWLLPAAAGTGAAVALLLIGRHLRRRRVRALEDSRHQLEMALYGGALGTWDYHIPSGRITYRPGWSEQFGAAPEGLESSLEACREQIHPDDLPAVFEAVEAHLAGRTPRIEAEFRMRTPEGGWFWLLARGKVMERDRAGQAVRACGTHEDVTARKEAEQSLRRYAKIISATDDLMAYVDGDLTFLEANEAFCSLFGKPRSEVVGCRVGQIFGEEPFASDFQHRLAECLEGKEVHFKQWLKVAGRGRYFMRVICSPARDESGRTAGAVVCIHDLTEMQFALDSLSQSEEKFRSLVEASSDFIWEVNPDGMYTYCSPRVKAMLGYEPSELLGKTPFDIMEPEEAERIGGIFRSCAAARQPVWNLVNVAIHKQGYPVVLETSGVPIVDEAGRLQGYRGMDRDITVRSQVQESLRHERDLVNRIMDTSPAGIVLLDPQGEITFANEQAQKILKVEIDEVTGRLFNDPEWKITDFDGRPPATEELPFSRVMQTGRAVFDVRHAIEDPAGRRVLLSVNAAPILDASGQIESVVAIVNDVTEHVLLGQKHQKNEELMENVFEGIQDGICVLDRDLNVVRLNRWMEEMYARREPVIGRKCYEVFQYRTAPCRDCPSLRAMETGRACSEIVPLIREGQRQGWIELTAFPLRDSQGTIGGVIEYVKDITGRREAEAALELRETELAGIVKVAPTGMGVAVNRILTKVNRRMCEMVGYSEAELIGQDSRMLYPTQEEYEKVGRERYRQIEENRTETTETRWVRKDGRVLDILLSSTPLEASDPSRGVTFTALDITDRKEAERRIRASEAYLSSILNTAPAGICVLVDRRIRSVNEQLCRLLGYSEAEFLGQDIRMIYPDEAEYERVGRELYRQMRETGKGTAEARVVAKDGRSGYGLVSGMPIDPEDWSKGITFAVMDITERKRDQQRMMESEERLRSISQAAPMGLVTFELQEDRLIFTDFNPAAAVLYHEPLEDKIGQSLEEGFPQLADTPLREGYTRLCREGGLWQEEQFTLVREGQTRVFEFSAFGTSPGKMAVLFSDITDRIRIRQALQESQRAMATLIGNLPGIVYRCANSPAWPMEFISKGCEEITGYTDADILSHRPDWNDLILEEDRGKVWNRIQEAVVGGRNFEIEYRIRTADGTVKWMWERGCAIYSEAGQVEALEGFISDYTALKQAQEKLGRRLKLEQLVAEISHGFAVLAAEEIDAEINHALGRLVRELPFDRVSLAEMTEDQSRIFMTDHVVQREAGPARFASPDLDRDFPALAAGVRRKEVVVYQNLPDSLPPQAAAEREYCRRYHVKSFLCIPMLVGDQHMGVLFLQSTSTAEIDTDLINYLKLFAEILANAILRQRNARAIAESERRFRSMAESSPMGILMYELQADDRLILTHMNPAAVKSLGLQPDDALGRPLEAVFPSLASSDVPDHYRRLCREGGSWTVSQFDFRTNAQTISYSFHAFQTSPGRLAIFFEDISERLRQQQALQVTQFAVDHTGEAVYRMAEDASFLYVNEAACRMLGYSRDELLNMTVLDIDPDLTPEKWREIWQEARQHTTRRIESRHRTREGRILPVEITGTRFEHEGQEMNFAFVRDISDRKAQEAAREKLLKELQTKNEELESIVFISSHDLRSPLVNIEGFTGELQKACRELDELLRQEPPDEEARRRIRYLLEEDIPESLHFIANGTSKMDSLLSGLLRLSRIGTATLNIRPIHMNHLMKSILGSMRYQIREESIQVDLEDLPNCLGDAVQINQVFTNLIDNAIKYRHPDRPCRIQLSGRREGNRSIYTVRDNGIGIAPQYHEKIFEIFHQLNPGSLRRGEGLGLTIVRRTLERQDGTVWVESQPGEGSAFHVSLLSAPE